MNTFGRDRATGVAPRTLDNVGIQYGLVAFNAGRIDAQQFIELNELMGGYDADGQWISARTVANPRALRVAYEHGMLVVGKSLGNLPIVDWNPYLDELANYHSRDRTL